MKPDEATLEDIIERVVSAAQPERIILFGSAVTGKMTRHSDIDLLVITTRGHRGKTTEHIYRRMTGAGYPVDVIVAHPEDLDRFGDSPAMVYREALRNGRVIYDR